MVSLSIELCALIPVYNHEKTVGDVARALLAKNIRLILVNDGSSPECRESLVKLANEHPHQVILLEHPINQGKGAAVMTGLRHADFLHVSHVLQIDADGQHNTDDIARFIISAQENPNALILGYPVYDETVPKVRLYGRYFTHVWVWINTLSFQIKDTMCGFRVYPVAPTVKLIARHALGKRMDFDTDIAVRLFWAGVPVINLPTKVHYYSDGVSHFRAVKDNLRIAKMHATHFFGMLIRLPILLARKWTRAR